jgi:DNA-binding CsgD family transcriptional regulator
LVVRTLSRLEHVTGAIAELTLESADHSAFRQGLLDCLDRAVGYDLASLHHARRPGDSSMCMRGYDMVLVEQRLMEYMIEFEPHEIVAAEGERPMVDTDVIPLARRERLSIYREQLWPHGVSVFTTAMWRNRHGAFGFHLARTGRGRRFRRNELECLEVVGHSIKLAEAYFCARTATEPHPASSFDTFADAARLSKGERDVARLAVRGLSNREIGGLLGISRLTVRNQLGSVFRKAEVSTRAELAFVSASGESPARVGSSSRAQSAAWDEFFRARSG